MDYKEIVKLYLTQLEKGKKFLFVLAPSQISKYDSQLPKGYKSYENDNADLFISGLIENNVPVLDLRDKMFEQQISLDKPNLFLGLQ